MLIAPARPGYGLALIEELGSTIQYWGCFILCQYPRIGSRSRTCRLVVCRKYHWHQNKLLSRSPRTHPARRPQRRYIMSDVFSTAAPPVSKTKLPDAPLSGINAKTTSARRRLVRPSGFTEPAEPKEPEARGRTLTQFRDRISRTHRHNPGRARTTIWPPFRD